MNAPLRLAAPVVRIVDPGKPDEARRIARFVADHPESTLFHCPQWSVAVERGCRQRSHYLVAEGQDGGLTGLLPLNEIRSRLFGAALVSAGFGVGGGIVADSEAAADALAKAAWELAIRLKASRLELRGGRVPPGFNPYEGVYAGFSRALPQSEEETLKSIPRRQRAEVRKGQAQNLRLSNGRDEAHLRDHFRVYSESVRNLGTPVFPRGLFAAMLAAFGDDADILTAYKDGRPVASVLSFYFKGTVHPYWGGGTHEARKLRANELLHFNLMRHAAARGCTRFDFGRSKLGTGAFAYKKNWGFEPEPLAYAVRTASGLPEAAPNPLDPKYRLKIALWRRLPLGLANLVGPSIARGLG